MAIQYLKQAEIDKKKWDACILKAHNSLIYAQSFYLDNCTNLKWGALVLNDYEMIMPVIFRKKYGIKYLYQPAFLQQAGVFSYKEISTETVHLFLTEIEKRFKFAEINLNYANNLFVNASINATERTNFILPLNNSYNNISANFKNDFAKNIKKANRHNLVYNKCDDPDFLISMYKKLYSNRFASVKQNDYKALQKNCAFLLQKNNVVLRTVSFNSTIVAGLILLKDANRLYNVASSITEQGKKLSANHALYSKVIEEFSEQDLIFDFEGSDLTGVAAFYKSMNPINQPYVSLKYNNLPKLLKLFKK